MVLRVKPTPTRFPANSLYTPMDNTPLHSMSSVCHPWSRCWGVLTKSQKGTSSCSHLPGYFFTKSFRCWCAKTALIVLKMSNNTSIATSNCRHNLDCFVHWVLEESWQRQSVRFFLPSQLAYKIIMYASKSCPFKGIHDVFCYNQGSGISHRPFSTGSRRLHYP